MNVDVMYQGLALVKGANARAEGGGFFVELEAPMPVGTRLDLVTPDGTRSGRVESVVEGAGAGMLVGFGAGAAVRTTEAKTSEPNAPMQEMKSAPPIQVAPAPEAPAEKDDDDEKPDDDAGRRKKRRPRKTVIGH